MLSRSFTPLLAVVVAAAAMAAMPACVAFENSNGSGGGTNSSSSAGGSNGAGGTAGLPCDVAQVLQDHCLTCHGNPTAQAAPESLNTYADLVKPSLADATQTYAQRAVIRMQDNTTPMPPAPATRTTAAEIAVIQAWIDAGYPMGSCGMMTSCMTAADCPAGQLCQDSMCIDPLNAAPTCTSGQYSYDHEGYNMAPGGPCTSCHMQHAEGGYDHPPYFAFAGTVFPTGHEPDNCIATPEVEQATVVIIDANGNEALHLTPNGVGNFWSDQSVALPYTAKVEYQGRERVMMTPQQSGDCNTCHTQTGTNTSDPNTPAPGRITLP